MTSLCFALCDYKPRVCETEHFESLLDIDSSHVTFSCLMSSGTYCEHIKAEKETLYTSYGEKS